MITKHAPGPWEYESDNDFHNDPNGVAYVDLSGGDSPESPSRYARVDAGKTAKHDALLIAHAPKLLKVLKSVLRAWDSIGEHEQVPESINEDALWGSVRNVIRSSTNLPTE